MLTRLCYPKLHFWTINSWLSGTGQQSHNFSLFVSPKFMLAAKKATAKMSIESVGGYIQHMAQEAGLNPPVQLICGEFGLEQINHPQGDGCWLHLEHTANPLQTGSMYSTHNCDRADQQSFLFAVWVWWSGVVEMYAEGES